mmetsp:Transcript_42897/g.77183  ORF Transcript_42897/g.77183 Transcript_42897/m.77183 type:complete len:202 (-) Transcript_42897:156-761(-)
MANFSAYIPWAGILWSHCRPEDWRRDWHFQNLLVHGRQLVLPRVQEGISANLLLVEERRIFALLTAKGFLIVAKQSAVSLPGVMGRLPGHVGTGCEDVPSVRMEPDVLTGQLTVEVQRVHARICRNLCKNIRRGEGVVRSEECYRRRNAEAVAEVTPFPPDPAEEFVEVCCGEGARRHVAVAIIVYKWAHPLPRLILLRPG